MIRRGLCHPLAGGFLRGAIVGHQRLLHFVQSVVERLIRQGNRVELRGPIPRQTAPSRAGRSSEMFQTSHRR